VHLRRVQRTDFLDKVQFRLKFAFPSMPSSRTSSSFPYEIPVMRSEGPFFRPTIVGHETVGRDFKSRLYHDYSTDAVERMELVLITVSGFAQVSISNTRERLRRGSVLLLSLPCDARIHVRDEGCPWEFLYFHASDAAPSSAFRWLRSQYGNIVHLPPRSRGVARLAEISKELCRDLRSRANHNLVSCSRRTYLWFLTLAEVLQEFRHKASEIREGGSLDASQVIGGCHTIKEYARQLHYSPSYLSRKLSKTWQKPPGRTLRIARLEQAASLLKDSDLSVWEVAGRVGYFSTSSFIRAFQELYKTTPAKFRHSPVQIRPASAEPAEAARSKPKPRKVTATNATAKRSRRKAGA
jgi:AraC-like DNA-binding protein